MKYVEFFGFGGSGKSTLVNRLVKKDRYVGPDHIFDINGWNTAGISLSSLVPREIRSTIGGVI